ncbi:MAG: acetyl-CoA C-acetyltransferase, partial [Pseudomonadales bacterium]
MTQVVIAGSARSAIGSFGGSLAKLSAVDIGAQVVKGLLDKTGLDPAQVDE